MNLASGLAACVQCVANSSKDIRPDWQKILCLSKKLRRILKNTLFFFGFVLLLMFLTTEDSQSVKSPVVQSNSKGQVKATKMNVQYHYFAEDFGHNLASSQS
jgi:hypothetical protein